jgi:hypothetical protein
MVELSNMRKQYPYIGNPLGFVLPKKKSSNKPLIKDWEDFSEEEKEILSEIKYELTRYLGEYPLYLYGSRVKGTWTEESDYDIIIEKVKQIIKAQLILLISLGLRQPEL